MKVYSGEVLTGECGKETHMIDGHGNSLRIGDIVTIHHLDEWGINYCHGLSVVVDHYPELYGDAEYDKPFVMGIKKVDVNNDENWFVTRVKMWEDVVDGEHWKDYGFNFKN